MVAVSAPASPDDEKPKPDWILARTLYAQGVATPEIAQVLGVPQANVRARIMREDWSRLRNKVQARAATAIQTVVRESISPDLRALLESSAKARQAIAHELLGSLETLQTTKHSRKLVTQRDRANVLATLAQVGKLAHGWGEANASTSIRIGVLNCATVKPPSLSSPTDPPTIEATTTETPNPES